ncbi:hypothetical protein V865_003009 [Kwoniella europaea PYCC6329]|uniref:Uncharacterized protein n=1 Tax=Kwoniella europaea PYCC6329 TaxID=1423913 RepID=A0AAX4KGP9_9TREE
MTNYNPLMSSYTIDSHGNLSFTNPTGSSGWMCRQSGTWGIQDCSGFSISVGSNGPKGKYGTIFFEGVFEGGKHQFVPGKDYETSSDGTFRFYHPDPSNHAWLVVNPCGRLMYEDSKGNFTVIEKDGKVTFVDIYVEKDIVDDDTPSSENGDSDSPTSESVLMPWMNLGRLVHAKRIGRDQDDNDGETISTHLSDTYRIADDQIGDTFQELPNLTNKESVIK